MNTVWTVEEISEIQKQAGRFRKNFPKLSGYKIASIVGVSPNSIYNWIRKGII